MKAGQLPFRIQIEFEFLAVFELAELLGLLVTGQYFMHGRAGSPTFSNNVDSVSPLATTISRCPGSFGFSGR